MLVINKTSFPVVACIWHNTHGYGDDFEIEPGQSKNIRGPFLGTMDGGECHIDIDDTITFQEAPDDENGYQVLSDKPLHLRAGNDRGISVRHASDAS